jgi:small subunit ribosomal protein S9
MDKEKTTGKTLKSVTVVGKKKNATARARVTKGKGSVRINSIPLSRWGSTLERTIIKEPLSLVGDSVKSLDIEVNVFGGGAMGQAAASRVAIARALVQYSKDDNLRKILIGYDDKILSGDSRQKEPCKPNRSSARSRRQKSYR